jgi:subtilisin family serine protease
MQNYMNRWKISLVLLLAFVACLLGGVVALIPTRIMAQESPPAPEPTAQLFASTEAPVPPFIPGTVLVGVRGDVAASVATWGAVPSSETPAVEVPWSGLEVSAVEPLDLRTGTVSTASADGNEPLSGYKLTVPTGTEWGAIETLLVHADVAFAEPDWLAQVAQSSPDTMEPAVATVESPFNVADVLYPEQWYLQRIGMSRAWSMALANGALQTIEVAVIDTGVDFAHPDLANRLLAGYNYVDNDATPMDDNGHGTHISGLVAAAANNGGMAGTGWQVEINPLKALDHRGLGGVSGIAEAIRDATDEGARIINLSLELSVDTTVLRSAVEYAASEGTLVIAAAGNQGKSTLSYPAAYPSVLAVGATTYFDARAYYSNRGSQLDIVAPGGGSGNSILSSWTRDPGALCPSGLRQVGGGLYCQADGTSMATGVVSGVAALVWSMRPDLDADAVRDILLETAAPITGSASEVGHGRLDAAMAVRRAMSPVLALPQNSLAASSLVNGTPIYLSLPLENTSLEPLTWEVALASATPWFGVVEPRSGTVSYGAPVAAQVVFTPTAVDVGTHLGELRVTSSTDDEVKTVYRVPVRFDVARPVVGDERLFLPWASGEPVSYEWTEATYSKRTSYAVSNNGSIVVELPFTMTVKGTSYTDLRIFTDGFVVASASALPPNSPTHCLANQTWPSFSAYGWWSDLSVGEDSSIATFQPTADLFVIEYTDLISAGSIDPDDLVSFQIVLNSNGEVTLNYAKVPEHTPSSVVIGVSALDGRFYNQITCHVGSTVLGEVPQANQSILFGTGDLY